MYHKILTSLYLSPLSHLIMAGCWWCKMQIGWESGGWVQVIAREKDWPESILCLPWADALLVWGWVLRGSRREEVANLAALQPQQKMLVRNNKQAAEVCALPSEHISVATWTPLLGGLGAQRQAAHIQSTRTKETSWEGIWFGEIQLVSMIRDDVYTSSDGTTF